MTLTQGHSQIMYFLANAHLPNPKTFQLLTLQGRRSHAVEESGRHISCDFDSKVKCK